MVWYTRIHDLTYDRRQYAGRSKQSFATSGFMIELMVVLNMLVGVKMVWYIRIDDLTSGRR